jgi:thiol-disulfide isomerase/thioredoxin
VKITGTVLFLAALSGCTTPAKDHPAGSAPSSGQSLAPSTPGSETAPAGSTPSPAAAGPSGTSLPVASASAAAPAAPVSHGSSAYVGCAEPIPPAHLWDETTESEVLDAISSAKACAAEHGRRLLLEFVAPWCEDCQEMAKLDEAAVVADTLRQRFERVRINVGKWDRHEGLRSAFGVHALATYIVIDPKTSKQLAKTTLEPITKKGQKLSAEQWAEWLRQH